MADILARLLQLLNMPSTVITLLCNRPVQSEDGKKRFSSLTEDLQLELCALEPIISNLPPHDTKAKEYWRDKVFQMWLNYTRNVEEIYPGAPVSDLSAVVEQRSSSSKDKPMAIKPLIDLEPLVTYSEPIVTYQLPSSVDLDKELAHLHSLNRSGSNLSTPVSLGFDDKNR